MAMWPNERLLRKRRYGRCPAFSAYKRTGFENPARQPESSAHGHTDQYFGVFGNPQGGGQVRGWVFTAAEAEEG
jgi:hypothetical protein